MLDNRVVIPTCNIEGVLAEPVTALIHHRLNFPLLTPRSQAPR